MHYFLRFPRSSGQPAGRPDRDYRKRWASGMSPALSCSRRFHQGSYIQILLIPWWIRHSTMYCRTERRSRLETICAVISIVYVAAFTSTAWILVVVFTLLSTFGVNFHTSSVGIRGWVVIGFIIGVSSALDAVAVCFLIFYLYRRRKPVHEARKPGMLVCCTCLTSSNFLLTNTCWA